MPRVVVFSGAGISAESGLKTFRDSDGLWEEYSIMDVATPEAWKRDSELVLRFYNERRKQMRQALPNPAHLAIVKLASHMPVDVITQNVDDLHERAGSASVLHLHGELAKVRSEIYPEPLYDPVNDEINLGDLCERGTQLRPHVVWFGESVPMIEPASQLVSQADILIIVGTSLNVYPAAGLVHSAPYGCRKILIDPAEHNTGNVFRLQHIRENAGTGLPRIVDELIAGFISENA
ncbi:MAG: NAD-dependent deacylase [Bacteroidia bacterium]